MAAEAIEVQQLLQLAREKSEAARSHLFEVMGDLFQEQASPVADGRSATEHVIERRYIGAIRMTALNRLLQLLRIAE